MSSEDIFMTRFQLALFYCNDNRKLIISGEKKIARVRLITKLYLQHVLLTIIQDEMVILFTDKSSHSWAKPQTLFNSCGIIRDVVKKDRNFCFLILLVINVYPLQEGIY